MSWLLICVTIHPPINPSIYQAIHCLQQIFFFSFNFLLFGVNVSVTLGVCMCTM